MTGRLLSLFPGIGLLDMAFEEEGFCVVRGPDLLWGGDVKRFHPPAGLFDGVIGGPPCQAFSRLRHIVEANGYQVAANLIPEFERVVAEAQPEWFVMENVEAAPVPSVEGYAVSPTMVRDVWVGGITDRLRRKVASEYCIASRESLLRAAERLESLSSPDAEVSADLAEVREGLEIIAGRRQCIDNLMGNRDVADAALPALDRIQAAIRPAPDGRRETAQQDAEKVELPKMDYPDYRRNIGELRQQIWDSGNTFHWQNDRYFTRLADGAVLVRQIQTQPDHLPPWIIEWTIPPTEWASIIAAVSATGETSEAYHVATDFRAGKLTEAAAPPAPQPHADWLAEAKQDVDVALARIHGETDRLQRAAIMPSSVNRINWSTDTINQWWQRVIALIEATGSKGNG